MHLAASEVRVDPSMSVKRKVTVPVGSSCTWSIISRAARRCKPERAKRRTWIDPSELIRRFSRRCRSPSHGKSSAGFWFAAVRRSRHPWFPPRYMDVARSASSGAVRPVSVAPARPWLGSSCARSVRAPGRAPRPPRRCGRRPPAPRRGRRGGCPVRRGTSRRRSRVEGQTVTRIAASSVGDGMVASPRSRSITTASLQQRTGTTGTLIAALRPGARRVAPARAAPMTRLPFRS